MDPSRRLGLGGSFEKAGTPRPSELSPSAPPDPVGLFVPGAAPAEQELRRAILKARDYATAAVVRSRHSGARTLLWMIVDIASLWAFAPASEVELRETRRQLLWLARIARRREETESGDAAS